MNQHTEALSALAAAAILVTALVANPESARSQELQSVQTGTVLTGQELLKQGMQLQDVRDYEAALASFDEAISLQPLDPLPRLARVYSLRALNRLEESIETWEDGKELFKQAQATDPDFTVSAEFAEFKAWLNLQDGWTRIAMHDYEGATSEFNESIMLAPNDPLPHVGVAFALRSEHEWNPDSFDSRRWKDAELALKQARRLAERAPVTDDYGRHILALVAFAEGEVAEGQEDYDRALSRYDAAMVLDSADAWPILMKGYLLKWHMGKKKQAARSLQQARRIAEASISVGHKVADNRFVLGAALWQEEQGRYWKGKYKDVAYNLLPRVIEYAPTAPEPLYYCSVALREYSMTKTGIDADTLRQRAQEMNQRALEIAPSWHVLHETKYWLKYAEGYSLAKAGDYDAAFATYDEALVGLPGEARIHRSRGYALLELGKLRKGDEKERLLAYAESLAVVAAVAAHDAEYSDGLLTDIQNSRKGFFAKLTEVAMAAGTVAMLARAGNDLTALNRDPVWNTLLNMQLARTETDAAKIEARKLEIIGKARAAARITRPALSDEINALSEAFQAKHTRQRE